MIITFSWLYVQQIYQHFSANCWSCGWMFLCSKRQPRWESPVVHDQAIRLRSDGSSSSAWIGDVNTEQGMPSHVETEQHAVSNCNDMLTVTALPMFRGSGLRSRTASWTVVINDSTIVTYDCATNDITFLMVCQALRITATVYIYVIASYMVHCHLAFALY